MWVDCFRFILRTKQRRERKQIFFFLDFWEFLCHIQRIWTEVPLDCYTFDFVLEVHLFLGNLKIFGFGFTRKYEFCFENDVDFHRVFFDDDILFW